MCGFDSWESWSSCSATCGNGTTSRTRKFDEWWTSRERDWESRHYVRGLPSGVFCLKECDSPDDCSLAQTKSCVGYNPNIGYEDKTCPG